MRKLNLILIMFAMVAVFVPAQSNAQHAFGGSNLVARPGCGVAGCSTSYPSRNFPYYQVAPFPSYQNYYSQYQQYLNAYGQYLNAWYQYANYYGQYGYGSGYGMGGCGYYGYCGGYSYPYPYYGGGYYPTSYSSRTTGVNVSIPGLFGFSYLGSSSRFF